MSDPKAIGPAMAVALLTTMYGAILANVFCIPVSMKLGNQADIEEASNEMIIEGILFIQDGGNPRVLGDVLAAFLSPKARLKLAPAA
jgi:chemotaxis protein MotA